MEWIYIKNIYKKTYSIYKKHGMKMSYINFLKIEDVLSAPLYKTVGFFSEQSVPILKD